MPDLHDSPEKRHHPAHLPPPPALADPPLNLADPASFRDWLARLRAQVDDALAAGEDATRAPSQRDLGRRKARSILLETQAALAVLFAAAERALPPAALEAR